MDKHKIDFEVIEGMTYCDRTKYISTIAGMPYPLFLLIVFEYRFIWLPFGFSTFLIIAGIELMVLMLLKKRGIPLRKLPLYFSEKKSLVRRALPSRKSRMWQATNKFD